MPALDIADESALPSVRLTALPFPPVTKAHILHCSYDYWHARYRSSALKSRIIPLNAAFLSYLREDGIVLPPNTTTFSMPSSNETYSASDGWGEEDEEEASLPFPELLQEMQNAIDELGGMVAPKLNWSAPKDATWISMNSMACNTPSEICLLLKTSDFVTHDLEHAFDGCVEDSILSPDSIQYVLVLRKWFKVNPSCEFRCFVRERRIIGICQRDQNHYAFLPRLEPLILDTVGSFFEATLRNTFPDESFTFDIYLPEPHDKVRLMDINPWAERTDPLLFSWLELLTMPRPPTLLGTADSVTVPSLPAATSDDERDDGVDEILWKPELRLVKKDDPEAYSFASPQYSAHKLPKDVVDASIGGESSMREFADQWKRMLDGELSMQHGEDEESEDEAATHS
ncbi:cell cycle control protein cdc123 [Phlyctema vagabunda]|uniref:Cell cycle control protein cdc123 n=1 Tax=Phlyctema vagabunda TaxID=108571 RepID=A0ABR4PL68_9HELO